MRKLINGVVRGSAITVAILASIQPFLGSFALFRSGGPLNYETIHLITGGILYNFALLLAVLAAFTTFRLRWILFSVSLAQYLLVHVQLRLGLASNEDAGLLAYHIPVGVAIFFLAYLIVAISFDLLRFPSRRGYGSEVEREERTTTGIV